MNLGPIKAAPIVTRIAAQVPDLLQVGSAANLAALEAGHAPDRCAFVLLGSESATSNLGGSDARRQKVQVVIGVVLGVRSYASATGGDPAALETAIKAVRAALVGWTHPDAAADAFTMTAFELFDGRVQGYDPDGMTWWLERYRADYWLTQ